MTAIKEGGEQAGRTNEATTTILIVDRDQRAGMHLEGCLRNLGYAVCGRVVSGREAVERAASSRPDLALVDLALEGEVTGPEAAGRLRNRFDVPVVFLADRPEGAPGHLLQRGTAAHPLGYVLRPFAEEQLYLTLETALAAHARERQQRESEARPHREVDGLEQLNDRMRGVLDSMGEGVLVIGKDRRALFHNASARRMGGDLLLKPGVDDWVAEYGFFRADGVTPLPDAETPLALALRGTRADGVDLFMRGPMRPEGAYVSVSGQPLMGKNGLTEGAVLVFRDITKLKLAEAELQQTLQRQREQTRLMETIFSSISDAVVVADGNGKFTMFNPIAEQIVGIGMLDSPPDEWTERYGVFYPDKKTHVPTGELPLVRAISGHPTDEIELFIRNEKRPNGVFISVSGRPLQPRAGDHGGGVIVFRDVTRQKESDAALAETLEELRYQHELVDAAFRSISDGIVVANDEGALLYVNPAAEQIVGMGITDGPQEEWSQRYGTYYPDRETPMPTEELPLLRAIHRGESVDEEDLFIRNTNRPEGVYIRVSARPLLNDRGGIKGGVIVFRDVTARVFAEEALVEAFAEGRLEIVDTLLHNIGNAMTSVTTGIETVRHTLKNDRIGRRLEALADAVRTHRDRDDWMDYLRDDPQGRQVPSFILAIAAGHAKHTADLLATIGRVRDRAQRISEIVRTQKRFDGAAMERKDIDLHEALTAAVRVLRDSLAKRRIRTTINCRGAPHEIRIRESQFHQMLVNLIKNAIEAIDDLAAERGLTRRPSIAIRAYSEGKHLNLDIADNGIGIATKDTKVLFAPGYTSKPSGSGLGLHSAANFVIGSGGRIQPMSDGPGTGTTMRVMLPLSSVLPAATDVGESAR